MKGDLGGLSKCVTGSLPLPVTQHRRNAFRPFIRHGCTENSSPHAVDGRAHHSPDASDRDSLVRPDIRTPVRGNCMHCMCSHQDSWKAGPWGGRDPSLLMLLRMCGLPTGSTACCPMVIGRFVWPSFARKTAGHPLRLVILRFSSWCFYGSDVVKLLGPGDHTVRPISPSQLSSVQASRLTGRRERRLQIRCPHTANWMFGRARRPSWSTRDGSHGTSVS